MFENDSSIDENLLELIEKLKRHTKENPTIQIIPEKKSWILIVPSTWSLPGMLRITYNKFNKKPFLVWWTVASSDLLMDDLYCNIVKEEEIFRSEFYTASQTVDCLLLLRYKNQGIPSDVIEFLMRQTLRMSLAEAILEYTLLETMNTLNLETIDPDQFIKDQIQKRYQMKLSAYKVEKPP